MRWLGIALLGAGIVRAGVVEVDDDASLRRALEAAEPGDEIVVKSAVYRGGIQVKGRSGTKEKPIVLRGEVGEKMPVFQGGGSTALQFSDCSYWVVENFVAEGFTGNGFNFDDGGSYETPARGLVLRNLHPFRIGPTGNHDGIKLSGLVDFRVENCQVIGWGGSAIDMVGCRDGVISGSRFVGAEGCSQNSGVQLKGGTKRVVVERCRFESVGGRAVNLGGSTGKPFFRPEVTKFEAEDIEVRDCEFIGGECAVAFVSSRGGSVHHNRIVRPDKWVMRILQEQPVPEFGSCGEGRFFRNVVLLPADHRVAVNVGPDTRPDTFEFHDNLWFHEGGRHRPALPVEEKDGRYGVDPRDAKGGLRSLEGYGPRREEESSATGND